MDLPRDFLKKMEGLLQEEYESFHKSYEENNQHGLRVNTLKVPLEEFHRISPFALEPIPWTAAGYYYQESDRPGKHPYHDAGLYYIQEPSAMAVGEIVAPQPGEKVLDLCAAPGGKTTHLAAKMKQQGLLLANEIHPARSRILSQNVERLGIKNAVVTNETPGRLTERFPGYFDRILVDAPCSGEGMFRKDPQACAEWSLENVALCADRQLDILLHAGRMLRPGGRLVYSTCTFSPEENEGVISRFLKLVSGFEVEEVRAYDGFATGRQEWITEGAATIEKTIRLWPHQLQGEGHYIAVLKKTDGRTVEKRQAAEMFREQTRLKDYFEFAKAALAAAPQGKYMLFGDQLYIIPEQMLSVKNIKVVRPGWHLGTVKKNRFEPSHALALAATPNEVKHSLTVTSTSPELEAFLRGEAIKAEGEKGWYLVNVDGYSIGWGKLAGGVLKNHYPKGLRRHGSW
ncbi:NOL1/NOP2/sun family putative RNA methylase [Evansella caseinilytica]|uniref:NOL1/NOP2/sun family putative RNA methylase n=1 Tax=Evansella caseinilytica TaxID=1503961 RepID=A0A1H3HAK7_9BACI|nr:RsmF rRNA methyltransferase first C-terminal domain-containing protein [Evansella caseinilytica]SDY12235.1 NOL1/NOP2/sun family putative RNA methylase [Evansella caseinilytica]